MDPERRSPLAVWHVTRDLLFGSRVAAAAADKHLVYRRLTPEDFDAASFPGGLLLVDLDLGREHAGSVIAAARARGRPIGRICGYGSHVDAEGLRFLQAAGADRAITRSRMESVLSTLLQELIAEEDQEST